jgi:hypothetical protein
MKELFRNPHPIDMSNYFNGDVCVLGGRDFEREEKESPKREIRSTQTDKKRSYELDWSFLKAPRTHGQK